jgi:hypothetical protein
LKRSKKLFLALAAIFFLSMIILGYDISRRTTFPGSKRLLIESLAPTDTVKADSANVRKVDN